MGNAKQTQKELMGAALEKKLQEFQYKHWRYRERFNEIWPGVFDGVRAMPQKELLATCKVVPHRLDIIDALPKAGVFAEVGTLHGDFIVEAIKLNRPKQVHIFDIDFSNLKPENRAFLSEHAKTSYHEGDSSSTLTAFGENNDLKFDVIYLDADHSYDGVWKDLVACYPLLKPDGYLVCNDYTTWDQISSVPYGVYWAVNRFANENDMAFEYLALESTGYHDVALRKRSARASR